MGELPKAVRQRPPDFEGIRKRSPNAYQPWSEAEDLELRQEMAKQLPVAEVARRHQRPPNAIRSRMRQLSVDPQS